MPLLIGEANPYGAAPEYALYPEPRGASGDRLCRVVLGLSAEDYLARFERVNLCPRQWGADQARMRAALLDSQREVAVPFVLLGKKVTDSFAVSFEKFTCRVTLRGRRLVILPHPSGRSTSWNERGAVERARDLLRREGVL